MRKKLFLFTTVLLLCLTGCGKTPDELNFMGGKGTLRSCSDYNYYAGQVYEDNSYYYYYGFKWAKNVESDQAIPVCTKIGCNHTDPDCVLNKYGHNLTFGNNVIYWCNGQTLFTITSDGNTKEIAKFTKDSDGNALPNEVTLDKVTVLNKDWLYIHMSYASGLYCLSEKHYVPLLADRFVSDDHSLFYLDTDQNIHCFSYEGEQDVKVGDAKSYVLVLNGNLLYYGDGHTSYCYNTDSKETESLRFFSDQNYNEMVFYADGETLYLVANDYDPIECSMSFSKIYRFKNETLDELPESINADWMTVLDSGEIVWIDANALNEHNMTNQCGIHLYKPESNTQNDYWVIQ